MGKMIDRIAHDQYIKDLAIYAIASNLARAIPDWRDGLKPSGRRILYALMHDEKAIGRNKTVKSASVTGTLMKYYHPHGEGIYETIKTMVNPFEVKVPMVYGQGNFGTIGGDPPAAKRYTECAINEFAMDCVIGALAYSDEVVSWNPNYSGTTVEPEYLPVKIPLLLVNGISGGIGTGIKSDLPQHNLSEVIDATIYMIDNINNPEAKVTLIPDHCMKCDIIDTDWDAICNTGSGNYKARAIIETSVDNKDNPILIITSLPMYGTTAVETEIKNGIASGKFPQIINIDDESQENNVRIVLTLKKGSDVNFVKESLFKYTKCERSCRINFEVVNGTDLIRFSYTEYLKMFIHFMITNKMREYSARLNKVETRSHMLEAFIKIVGSKDIDKIIDLIRKKGSGTDNDLIELLIKTHGLTDIQASYIINATIKQLAKSRLLAYQEEYKKLIADGKWLDGRLSNTDLIANDIRDELLEIKAKYGTPRLCNVVKISNLGDIPDGDFRIIITENNFIRKVQDLSDMSTIKGDIPKFAVNLRNTQSVLLFDSRGRVYRLPIHKIPITPHNDCGLDIKMVIKGLTADIISIIEEPKIEELVKRYKGKVHLAVLSKNNTIKKLDIEDFLNVPLSGIIYSKPDANNEIVTVRFISNNIDLVIYSKNKVLRINATDVPIYKRNAAGVSAMNSANDIENLDIIYDDTEYIVVVTDYGYFNKFSAAGLVRSKRGRAGSSVIKLAKGGSIKAIYACSDNNYIRVNTINGVVNVDVAGLKFGSSVSTGEKVLNKTDTIISTELITKM
nr:MAG TPA: DNA topoisomerase 2 alpha [Caudoviricetes sp.]